MKKLIISFILIPCFLHSHAQDLEKAKQEIYHERYTSAANTLDAILQQQPTNAEAWYWRAETYIQDNDLKGLSQSLHTAPQSITDQPFFQTAYGALMLQENKPDSATEYFNAALKETKEKDPQILAAVARANIEAPMGNTDYALELLDKAIHRDKNNANLYILKGNAYRKANNGSEAYKAYQEAINRDENSAIAYYDIGNIFLTQKNPEVYLDYYNKAVAADTSYAPAWYQLYEYYFYHDPSKAMDYFNHYNTNSDKDIKNKYAYTDLLYLNKNYPAAIQNAEQLLQLENKEPRLYKLLAYSYEGLKDTAKAISYMQEYFTHEADSNFIPKDFEAMASWYSSTKGNQDSAIVYLSKAAEHQKDSTARYAYYKKLADLSQSAKDYAEQAEWLGKYYTGNSQATNVDLFNWGLAYYRAGQYKQADSVFGLYVAAHPDQGFGYYWEARSNVALDSTMEKGLAIPYYQKLIDIISKDSTNPTNKKWLVEAYGYMAAYETNTKKDYAQAIDYFQKLLQVDPENADAKKYIAVLEKRVADNSGSKGGSQ
jgi:tetratricopeptide (TPR) repeat protein